MSDADLGAAIAGQEKLIVDAEENFKNEVSKLQETYQQLMADKDKTAEDVKASGLGLMKSVQAFKAKGGGKDEL